MEIPDPVIHVGREAIKFGGLLVAVPIAIFLLTGTPHCTPVTSTSIFQSAQGSKTVECHSWIGVHLHTTVMIEGHGVFAVPRYDELVDAENHMRRNLWILAGLIGMTIGLLLAYLVGHRRSWFGGEE